MVRDPTLFGTPGDRIGIAEIQARPRPNSLGLVAPKDLQLISQVGFTGNPQARGRFSHNGHAYTLAITDPGWTHRITSLSLGTYAPEAIGLNSHRIRLTISLGEPTDFDGNCYKLIAGMFELPPS